MNIKSDMPALRTESSVRDAIDALYRDGLPRSVRDINALPAYLWPSWLLGELSSALGGRMHIYSQQLMTGAVDGADGLARVATAIAEEHPVAADVCAWVAARGARHRQREQNEPFASVTHSIGAMVRDEMAAAFRAVAERWPDDSRLADLAPRSWPSAGLEPSDGQPRFPTVTVTLDEPDRGAQHAIDQVAFALWRAGASDDALDAWLDAAQSAEDRLPETIAAWVGVNDPLSADELRARLFPPHPLEAALSTRLDRWDVVVLAPDAAFEVLQAALIDTAVAVHVGDESVTAWARAALRMDPEGLVVRAGSVGADDVELLLKAAQTGHAVVACGAGPSLELIRERAEAMSVAVIRV